ncbi:restriction endonuclease subunit S [Shewanella indica]|uniref:restriction endonuclease subunit S n=1 Tax=Shewanella indica TaxID=768528 RepID=UPI00399B5758
MSDKYVAYPEYKDSGVEWLGAVPIHWMATRLKFVANVNMGQSPSSEDCNDLGDGLPFLQGNAEFTKRYPIAKQYCPVAKKIANSGDLLFSVRAPVGALNEADQKYGIGRGLCAISSTHREVNSFMWWVLQTARTQLDAVSTGSTFESVSAEQVAGVSLIRPTFEEQRTIAAFLDYETARIDSLIDKQQRLIELLKEKRQAVISHAVTKGLNPDAPMKDSGVEWLGQVPEHWGVTRAKLVSDIFVPQRNKPELNDSGVGVNWATMEDMKSDNIKATKRFVSIDAFEAAGSKVLRKGAVVASCVGNFGIASVLDVDVVINQQLQAYIPKKVSAPYLRDLIGCSKVYFDLVGTAATLVYVNKEGFGNLPVPIPPMDEQKDIEQYTKCKKELYDKAISKGLRQVALLQERRTSLISAAVTGKIDLRGWNFPEAKQ